MMELPEYMLPQPNGGTVRPLAQTTITEVGIGARYSMGNDVVTEQHVFHICGHDNFKHWVNFWREDLDRGSRMLLWTVPSTDKKQRILIPEYSYQMTTKYKDRWTVTAEIFILNLRGEVPPTTATVDT